MEDGLGEEKGEGSGPKVLGGEDSGEDVGEVFSGELGGVGEEGCVSFEEGGVSE